VGSGKREAESGEQEAENGEREMESGERCAENGEKNEQLNDDINKPNEAEPQLNEPNEESNENTPILNSSTFPAHWQSMFTHVFSSVPTIYIPLKDSLPKIENNIIKLTVKNDIQKEHFEAKKREALEYLRTHCDEQIEDIVIETDEQLVTKKIIYDVKDKLQNFKEQNEEFEDFLQILDLQIKD
jgi:hypothetical protein